MKHRSLGKMFALFLVTIGIYRLYWFAKTRKEMMTISSVKIPTIWVFIIPVLIFLVSIVFFIFATINDVQKTQNMCGPAPSYSSASYAAYEKCRDTPSNDQSTLAMAVFYLSFLFILPITFWWLWKYCKAIEEVTKEKMQFGVAMLITLLVPDGIDMLIIQDSFNKIATHGHKASA